MASTDPVAIDQAALDLVNQQIGIKDSELGRHVPVDEDKFLALRPQVDGRHTLEYAEKLKMGSREYQLIKI